MLNRERIKLSDQHRGIKDMRRLPDAVIIVDAKLESTAVNEANRLGIPIIALIDSNTDPSNIDFPIPANDDSIRTIQLIMTTIADTILDSRTDKITKPSNSEIDANKHSKEESKKVEVSNELDKESTAENETKDKAPQEGTEVK
jgi:small subunit ribosomal protein S2